MAKQVKNNAEKKPPGKGKKIMIAIIALIIIGAAAFAGFYFLILSKDTTEKIIEPTVVVLSKETKINLSDKKASYVMTGISIAYDSANSKLEKEIIAKTIQLQDKAIWYLKSKVTTDFEASKEVELKTGLVNILNKELENGKILNVYYSTGDDTASFIIQ
ncbi:hypothetical protein [Clostridium vincentii]|uniref:Flagellar basal body-associated protein FliL n=1 Tax=Clostridium vincentii TaxID=52704 RepID=A0A2T0BJB0_9CLOT|nr:hypothetical protein [Clostridium vincentii]PRR83971.1 flagellar basal body-associated protein FliL [Clostridium vincentii]